MKIRHSVVALCVNSFPADSLLLFVSIQKNICSHTSDSLVFILDSVSSV